MRENNYERIAMMRALGDSSGHQQRGAVLVVSLILLLVVTLLGIATMQTSQLEMKMANNSMERQAALSAAEVAIKAGEEWLKQYPFNKDNFIPRPGTAGATVACASSSTCFNKTCDSASGANSAGLCFNGEYVASGSGDPMWVNSVTGTGCNTVRPSAPSQTIFFKDSTLNVWATASKNISTTVDSADPQFMATGQYIIEFRCYSSYDITSPCSGSNPQVVSDAAAGVAINESYSAQFCAPTFQITALGKSRSGVEVMLQSTFRQDLR